MPGAAEAPLLVLHRPKEGGGGGGGGCGATWAQTLGNIVVSLVGTGVLGLPYAFRVAGWLAGSLGVAAAGLATYYTMTLLVECRKKLHDDDDDAASIQIHSYGDLGFRAFGAKGRCATELLVFISQAGGAIAYLVFIGQNLSSVLSAHSHTIPSTAFIIFLLLPLEIALSFIRSLSALAPFSAFADACNVLAMAVVLKDDVQLLGGSGFDVADNAFNGVWGLPFTVGVAVFCFDGFSMTLPLEGSMDDRGLFRWVLSRAFLGVALAYICFGLFGYMAYGEDTKDIVTLNLPNGYSSDIVKIGLCVALAFTFPSMMHPVHDIAESRLKKCGCFKKICHHLNGAELFGFHFVRTLLVVATALVALLIPGFGAFISFVGCTVCAMLAFVLPATFHLVFLGPELQLWKRTLDYILLVTGLFFAVYGTYAAASGHSLG